jgi:flagellar biogenesis protein FliO
MREDGARCSRRVRGAAQAPTSGQTMLWMFFGIAFVIFAALVIFDVVRQSKQTNRDRR